MQNKIWIDLGFIGNKSNDLQQHFEKHLLNIPTEIDCSEEVKYVVLVDYVKAGQKGVKVLTNAFENKCEFNQYLVNKLIEKYVKGNNFIYFQENL